MGWFGIFGGCISKDIPNDVTCSSDQTLNPESTNPLNQHICDE